jgi:hypothetical protein
MFRAQSNIFDDVVVKATDENLTSENWEYILVWPPLHGAIVGVDGGHFASLPAPSCGCAPSPLHCTDVAYRHMAN